MKNWFLIGIAGMALFVAACSPALMVGKGEMKARYLGSNVKIMYDMLCVSGDLVKVLETTHFSKEMKDSLYKYNCSDERSGEKVRQLFLSMTPAQRKDIKMAFKENGYSINGGSC